MSLDEALVLARKVLADYESSGAGEESGLALVWVDQVAHVLRELAGAASAWRTGPACDRSAAMVTGHLPGRPDGRGPGRVRGWLAWLLWVWAGRVTGRVPAE